MPINTSTEEAEAGEPQVPDQPELYSKTLFQKKKKMEKEEKRNKLIQEHQSLESTGKSEFCP
jgi:hypothetical protein